MRVDCTLKSSQHRAAKLIFTNSGLHTNELNTALGLVPFIIGKNFTLSCLLEDALMLV